MNRTIPFVFLMLFILCFAGCKGETGKVTMKEFLIDELWDMETEALNTIKELDGINVDKQLFTPVCKKTLEVINKVKNKLNNYAKAEKDIKDFYTEHIEYGDFFIKTVASMEENQDCTAISDIVNKWNNLLTKRNQAIPAIIEGIDINDKSESDYIEHYIKSIYMNNYDDNFTAVILNNNSGYPDSVPLLYALAESFHYESAEKCEYDALTKLEESTELSVTIQDWIQKRLHYLDLYKNCGTPGFWTEDKIKLERGLIASRIKTGGNIHNWFTTCYEKEEYVLAENLAQVFADKKEIITRDGKIISGAEYMKSRDYEHFTSLSFIMKALKDFAEAFVARDLLKIAEYIIKTVGINDFPDYPDIHYYNKETITEYTDDLFDYIDSWYYEEAAYKIDGYERKIRIAYKNSFHPDRNVEVVCSFDYENMKIAISSIDTYRTFMPDYGDYGYDYNYDFYYGDYYGYDEYGYEGTPFISNLSDEELSERLEEFALAFVRGDNETIERFILYSYPSIDDQDFDGLHGSETVFHYLDELYKVIDTHSCNKWDYEIDDDFHDDFSVWISIVYYCESTDKNIKITCSFYTEQSDVILDSIKTVRFGDSE